mmetsp:Transcript_15583/g.27376  ORF Transcript_15583/g.27376 Transcript_15583/m.27376 type:complete len:176 (+) Transcript_15583:52-579(+)
MRRGRRLNRGRKARISLLKKLTQSLIQHERIETTVPRAKEVRRYVERMIALAKRGPGRRHHMFGYVFDRGVTHKVYDELLPRYANRPGGFTRVLRTKTRKGDSAPMAVIELMDSERTILTREQLEFRRIRKEQYIERRQNLVLNEGLRMLLERQGKLAEIENRAPGILLQTDPKK